MATVLKLGGELLDDRGGRRGRRRRRSSGSPATTPLVVVHGGGRAIDAELRARGRHAGLRRRPAHHRRRGARRGRRGARRADQHAAGRGDRRRRRPRGRADRRRRPDRAVEQARGRSRSVAGETRRSRAGRRSRTATDASLLTDLLAIGCVPVVASIGVVARRRAAERQRRHDRRAPRGAARRRPADHRRRDRRRARRATGQLIPALSLDGHRPHDRVGRRAFGHGGEARRLPRRARPAACARWRSSSGRGVRAIYGRTGVAATQNVHREMVTTMTTATRRDGRRDRAPAAGLPARPGGVRARQGLPPVRRRRPRVPRPDLRRRRRVARPRATRGWRRRSPTQARELLHTSNLYFHPLQGELAARLAALSGLPRAFFCNSGTEAVEACLKFARTLLVRAGRRRDRSSSPSSTRSTAARWARCR